MARKRKTKAERREAANKFNQSSGAQAENRAAKLKELEMREELAPIAAAFLVNADDCCPREAQRQTGLNLRVIENISLGRFEANTDQADIIFNAAQTLGWKPPAQTQG